MKETKEQRMSTDQYEERERESYNMISNELNKDEEEASSHA
jgi:hypothetical protein